MFTGFWLLVAILGIVVALGVLESAAHRRRLQRIPIRVHVNGTRGKSSVTRLVAAGMRAGGIRTCAKTTGTLSRMILPDGTEYPVFRPSGPNVIEQVRIIGTAATFKAQAIVIECMALQPLLQWLSESRLVRATHSVITNARPDHLDVMGPDDRHVALALAGTVAHSGLLFSAERKHRAVFARAAKDRKSRTIWIEQSAVEGITAEDLRGFSYVEHAENVALALRVCQELGIDRATALSGMHAAQPDPGAMTMHEIDFFGRRMVFVNGFAANDPESTERIWRLSIDRAGKTDRRIVIVNCRADRPDRSKQLAASCVNWPEATGYVLVGTGTYIFATTCVRAGLDSSRLVFTEGRQTHEMFETVLEMCGESTLIMGMGNIGGPGLEIVRYFKNRAHAHHAI